MHKIFSLFRRVFKHFAYFTRFHLCRLKISAHSLRLQTGRFSNNRTPQNVRVCLLCNMNEVEDELHFMFICPKYSIVCRQYIDNYYFRSPSTYKLVELFIKKEKRIILDVAHYIEPALSVRFHFFFFVQVMVISSLC